MSKEFKVGDVVECINDEAWPNLEYGKVYTIIDILDADGQDGLINIMYVEDWPDDFKVVSGASHDPVNKPIHYQLTESLEVKDLMKILLERIENSDIGFSHFQSSCYKEAMQYLLRFMLKNGYEDLEKAQVYLTEVIENKRA